MLSPETWKRVNILFKPEERKEAAQLLNDECGTNLPFLERLDEYGLERFQFAALKLSQGDLSLLRRAVKSAQIDWRDLLMAAGFGENIEAHKSWLPEKVVP